MLSMVKAMYEDATTVVKCKDGLGWEYIDQEKAGTDKGDGV